MTSHEVALAWARHSSVPPAKSFAGWSARHSGAAVCRRIRQASAVGHEHLAADWLATNDLEAYLPIFVERG
jgi:hypothetical protein